ncbi:MAG: NADH-quinone oxidoreductase subunit N [Deltaproteobacteria bacterium]|nr:NADH-quinone oxidoreductase subunit N [Deltaproteobacteria bacterium]MBW2503457.1 NADH-quinone oxidoreductase subunit N [Deltaproteobacteria bacterium]MBW2519513.1 NADH-quinone oxidoreductase subunit N [Deltaproteobacteria bacterium]
MNWLDLLALGPHVFLVFGATSLLLLGAWCSKTRVILLSGIFVSLLSALLSGIAPPVDGDIAGLFSAGGYARFFTIFWFLTAAITLMISVRFSIELNLNAGEYVALVLFAALGMALLSSAIHLLGLFLGLEALTLAFYVLIASNRRSELSAEAGLKYLLLGAVATGFLAFGIGLVYTASGSLHLPEAFQGLQAEDGHLRAWGLLGWGLLLTAVGFKISLVPFHLWTADVYQGTPSPVAAFLSTGAKGAVVAGFIGLVISSGSAWKDLSDLLWVVAALTMIFGALGGLPQNNLKRLLAYSSIAHMGTVLVGILCQTPTGFSATIFYIVVYVIANLGTFGVIASFSRAGEEPEDLDQWRGLGYRNPLRCTVLTLLLLSLAGLPATAGFIGKFAIFHAAIQSGLVSLAIIGIISSLIAFAYYLKVVIVMFSPESQADRPSPGEPLEFGVLAACTTAVILLGLFPGPLFDLISKILP